MTGVLLAIPPVDFIVHNSLFLVAHFHHVIIGGVVFASWPATPTGSPRRSASRSTSGSARRSSGAGSSASTSPSCRSTCSASGARRGGCSTFRPGLAAVARRRVDRRADHRSPASSLTVVQLLYSIQTRDQRRDVTGDPWDGRTLEWLTLSPPPHYNFAVLPDVHGEEAYWTRKQRAIEQDQLIDRARLPADRNAAEHADRRDRRLLRLASAASRSSGTSGGSRSSAWSAPSRSSSGTPGATSMSISSRSRRCAPDRPRAAANPRWNTSTS